MGLFAETTQVPCPTPALASRVGPVTCPSLSLPGDMGTHPTRLLTARDTAWRELGVTRIDGSPRLETDPPAAPGTFLGPRLRCQGGAAWSHREAGRSRDGEKGTDGRPAHRALLCPPGRATLSSLWHHEGSFSSSELNCSFSFLVRNAPHTRHAHGPRQASGARTGPFQHIHPAAEVRSVSRSLTLTRSGPAQHAVPWAFGEGPRGRQPSGLEGLRGRLPASCSSPPPGPRPQRPTEAQGWGGTRGQSPTCTARRIPSQSQKILSQGSGRSHCSPLPTSMVRAGHLPRPGRTGTAGPAFPWGPQGQAPAAGRAGVGRPRASAAAAFV